MGPADENRDEGLRLVNFGKARFCVNCQHIGTNGAGEAKLFRCFAPQNLLATPDLVTGGKQYKVLYCYQARTDVPYMNDLPTDSVCGSAGLWWEQQVVPERYVFGAMVRGKPSAEKLLDDLENL